ncbi:SbtR family transcriptional regulator [Jiangella rhizosphaerae]|uniref:Transcriptional regulator SbtR-like C-terminal domain-containing protein n=1 Tax=Jiangella rhizosphaerae TaxID=2293569 RepID=A0A418KWM0_9ACTN|nr:hypothetical protein [Jiangella rhizosphaerae]RIQ35901.1 hypothetical protein DY240_01995 [Jiangella rhizosphaerae]
MRRAHAAKTIGQQGDGANATNPRPTQTHPAGAVRADVGTAELDALLIGAARAVEHAGGDPDVRRRTLAVILDGLRPGRGDAVSRAPTP